MNFSFVWFCVILIIINVNLLLSQDSQYWVNQYGTRADLLSGLVVGSVKDLSSTFYNPGAIPLSPEQSLVLTTDAVEFSTITIKNGAGSGLDLRSQQSGTAPGIFVVRLTSSASVKNHWAISYITRNNFKLDVDGRNIESRQPGTGNLAQDYFSGEVNFMQKIDESWAGITYGRNIWNRTAFGITQYLAFRSQRGRSQIIGQLYEQSGDGSSAIYFDGFDYTHIRTLWKFGLSFAYRPLSFGFTVTTPSIGIWGDGETVYNLSLTEVDTAGTGSGVSSLASNFQNELSTVYRSPLSIAVGATYYFRKSSIYFSLEWFDEINKFKVMEPESFIAQSSGNSITTTFEHELKSVTNYGFGFQHEFHDRLSVYASMILDKSARITDSNTPFSLTNWDIYHFTVGSAFTFWRLDLTAGLNFSFGSDDSYELIDNNDLPDDTIFEERFEPKKVTYRRIRLILGFTILSKPA